MKMNREKVLGLLCDMQKTCASIDVSIGTTRDNNFVDNKALVIKNAPPIVIDRLIKEGYSLDIIDGGVEVDYHGDDEEKR